MQTPKVSIIIPVYNVEKYLRQCLDSIINQTLRDIEIICVDDGSTDGSRAVLDEYSAKDTRLKVMKQNHSNAGACRNAAMAVAKGEYLGFVDADDFCDLTLFEKAYTKAKSDDADVVSYRFRQYDERTKKFTGERAFSKRIIDVKKPFTPCEILDELFSPIMYAPWGRIVRRSFIEQESLRFQEIVRTNDVYFYCLTVALAQRQTIVDEVLYSYRIGTGTNLQSNNAASPNSVIEAWDLVADELQRRGLLELYRRNLASSSANSLFYTLNVMSTTPAYVDFFKRLKTLYQNHHFYSKVVENDIFSSQTSTYFRLLKRNKTAIDFLVQQENYYQERLAVEYWAKIGAQKTLESVSISLKKERAEFVLLKDENSKCKKKIESQNGDLIKLKDELKKNQQESKDIILLLREGNEKYLKKIEDQRRDLIVLNEELTKIRQESSVRITLLECRFEDSQRCIEKLSTEKSLLERSISFKLGKIITWVPRKALVLIDKVFKLKKGLHDHG